MVNCNHCNHEALIQNQPRLKLISLSNTAKNNIAIEVKLIGNLIPGLTQFKKQNNPINYQVSQFRL